MPTPQTPDRPSADEPLDGQDRPRPDEDGPHDVPDEAVIEKTLPSGASDRTDGRAA
ncbi:MAG TPA: hypothetical protein VFE82_05610 [Ramlibacter sp.]|jgi:hypothetical protein|uniref:hypothetical protein n=1 Tax=Ramlibacter sp. TaxID=1917967 RepID=UPI002D6A055C|nr:hypothetical protein [Ramlibacter sp.]HZY17938.1 hypothetical protein [Ramlibacter sp.]